MRLVDDDGVIGIKKFVALRFSQQNAVGHQLDKAVLRALLGKTHLKTHTLPHLLAQFFSDARGHAAGGNSTGLGVTDQAMPAAPRSQRDFWQLSRFAGAGLAGEHDHLIVANQRGDFISPLRHRQTFGVKDRG